MSKIIDDTKKHDDEMKICITELFISFDNFFKSIILVKWVNKIWMHAKVCFDTKNNENKFRIGPKHLNTQRNEMKNHIEVEFNR